MLHFYIEAGLGIVHEGDFSARTPPLFDSALIAAYNRTGDIGGAFHYPVGGLSAQAVRNQMDQWLDRIRPDEVTVTFSPVGLELGLRSRERHALELWLVMQSHCVPIVNSATSAAMLIDQGQMRSGMISEIGVALAPLEPMQPVSQSWVGHSEPADCTVFGSSSNPRGNSAARTTLLRFPNFP